MTTRHAAVARHVLWLTLRREAGAIRPAPFHSTGCGPGRAQSTAASTSDGYEYDHEQHRAFRPANDFGRVGRRVVTEGYAGAGDCRAMARAPTASRSALSTVDTTRAGRPDAPRPRLSSGAHTEACAAPTFHQLLSLPAASAAPLIPSFLATIHPRTVGAMNADVRRLRRLISHMSPTREWSGLEEEVRRALLALWARWLALVVELRDVGGLPRMRGREGAEFGAKRFTPLFLALLSRPSSASQRPRPETTAAVAAALAMMDSVHAMPTDFQLELVVRHLLPSASVRDIVAHNWQAEDPGVAAQRLLALLLPESAGADTVTRAAATDADVTKEMSTPAESSPSSGAQDEAVAVGPQTVTASTPRSSTWPASRARVLLSCGDVALAHMERDRGATSNMWRAAACDMTGDWRRLVEGYCGRYMQAARGEVPRTAPTVAEAHALHLLARYTLATARAADMRGSQVLDVAGVDAGDPLVCLALMLGTGDAGDAGATTEPQRPAQVDKRIVSVLVRWAHHASSRRLLWPVVSLLDVLTGKANPVCAEATVRTLPPPVLSLRTALFLTGAAREPEDLGRILAPLEALAVKPDPRRAELMADESGDVATATGSGRVDGGSEPYVLPPRRTKFPALSPQETAHRRERRAARRVPLRILSLAREADTRGITLPDSNAGVETRVRALFDRWGLPPLHEENEREQRAARAGAAARGAPGVAEPQVES